MCMLQCSCLNAVRMYADLMMLHAPVADVPAVELDAELARQLGASLPPNSACSTSSIVA